VRGGVKQDPVRGGAVEGSDEIQPKYSADAQAAEWGNRAERWNPLVARSLANSGGSGASPGEAVPASATIKYSARKVKDSMPSIRPPTKGPAGPIG